MGLTASASPFPQRTRPQRRFRPINASREESASARFDDLVLTDPAAMRGHARHVWSCGSRPGGRRCLVFELVEVTAEHGDDPSWRQPLGSHRRVEREPVEQSMEAFGLQRPFSPGREPEHLDGAQRGRAQRVIDLGASHSELGIDQGAGGERQPDLIFGAPLVVQGQQFGQQLLDRAAGIVGKLERPDALGDPLGRQLDREVEQLRLGAEVVT